MRPFPATGLLILAAVGFQATAAEERLDYGLTVGDRGTLLTTIEPGAPEEIPLRYIGTISNFSGPGHDVHLVELEGPLAEAVGVANGMSGSPVYFDGELIGALSYRLGVIPKRAIAGCAIGWVPYIMSSDSREISYRFMIVWGQAWSLPWGPG